MQLYIADSERKYFTLSPVDVIFTGLSLVGSLQYTLQ